MTDVVESLIAISQPVSLSTNARTSFSTTNSAPSFYENPVSGRESTLIPTTEEIQKICPRSALQPDLVKSDRLTLPSASEFC